MPNKLRNMDEQRLLSLYSELMEELRDRELIRSSNNPVADYAEKITVEYMRLTRTGKKKGDMTLLTRVEGNTRLRVGASRGTIVPGN